MGRQPVLRCLFQGRVYGSCHHRFPGVVLEDVQLQGFVQEARISRRLVRVLQNRKWGREGKEEEGIEDLSYSESVYLKIETTLHWKEKYVKIKRPFYWVGGSLKSSKYLKLKKLVKTQDPLRSKRLIKISGLYPRKAIYLLGKTDILTCRQLISAFLPPTVSEIAKMIDFWDWLPHKWDLPEPKGLSGGKKDHCPSRTDSWTLLVSGCLFSGYFV